MLIKKSIVRKIHGNTLLSLTYFLELRSFTTINQHTKLKPMKNILLVFFLIFGSFSAKSQILKPVTWSYAFKKTSATEAVVYIKASIENGWHIYSQNIKEGGPIKTSFTFAKSPAYTLNGATTEPKPITNFEKTFDMNVSYFENTAVFAQKIKLKGKTATVKGTLEYMTCDDHQCLPPEEVAFSIAIK